MKHSGVSQYLETDLWFLRLVQKVRFFALVVVLANTLLLASGAPSWAQAGAGSHQMQAPSTAQTPTPIRAGSTSIGSCVGHETHAGGLALYRRQFSQVYEQADAKWTFVSVGAKFPLTVKVENCSSGGERLVDVAITLAVSMDRQIFDLPLSALDVPVR